MMKKLYSLLLILTPIKKAHAFQKFMSVLIIFVAIKYEEMLKKDFALKYFLAVNLVLIRITPLHMKHKNTSEKFITNSEAYLEPVKYRRWNFLA